MITFKAEHRSNGITYVTVEDDGKFAGAFSLYTSDWQAQHFAIENIGETIADPPAGPFVASDGEAVQG